MIHDDRIEAFDAASQLIEGLKVHQEKEIEKKVTKTLNKLTTTSKNSGGKRNPRSKRETTVSQNIYIYIYQKKYNLLYESVDRFWFGKQDNFSKLYGNLTYVSCIISISRLHFPSHLKKLHFAQRFRLLNLNCGFFFTRFTHEYTPQNNYPQ